ncbi:hypothetical protein M885DRAFT_522947 [Pelagophyceae sp. CCMP2097]|nr:hypothetical protein M885DRAFT_522947 [Pelagophyceae sp. CCMP2097]|mmetsp:Transcript_15216/g.51152  ORF Transcript_15216/g.51152 Transcript_15216/m.51152 type:complete len:471 (-) Transcript_15216:128-1540(-)
MGKDDDKKALTARGVPTWVVLGLICATGLIVAHSGVGGGAAPAGGANHDALAADVAAAAGEATSAWVAPEASERAEAVVRAPERLPEAALSVKQAGKQHEAALSVKQAGKQAGKQPRVPDADAARLDAPVLRTQLRPMWGLQHIPTNDVVMALGFGYSRQEFARFISTLRGTGYDGDIALAAGPEKKMKAGVAAYLKGERVLAYGFEYSCVKGGRRLQMTPSGCVLTNWYAGGDSRGPRPLALSRYEMYRSWLLEYDSSSWGLIFDFRDTFFQLDPFKMVDRSSNKPNLHLFAENRKVKRVGNCVFNGGWLQCWGKDVPKTYANNSVVCSGSTMGTVDSLLAYSSRMIAEFDKMQCHATPARTESDQGYHNYLYDTGVFAALKGVRVVHHEQGEGLVNTIGAMNGYRVPANMKGPLDTHWKIRDASGYILEYDGSKSAVVHQWDRFFDELFRFVDRLVKEYEDGKASKLL